ncbi:hypothetical protein [Pedobacter foliorum]|uniref:hypothetical protein n=1 Tax=Pedobacter foliorum TaxID=2739058 RepID=UPI001564ECC4|nr:hypothetical protein [Pedobacter foliorum]NRF40078.1 hypothetical protein [Pedobacter foliorum]
MKTYLTAILIMLMATIHLKAQRRFETDLIKEPGIWKNRALGNSISGTAAEVAKEKTITAAIHNMVKQSFSPMGMLADYSFSYVKNNPPNPCNYFSYQVYFLKYNLNEAGSAKPYQPTTSSNTNIRIIANGSEAFTLNEPNEPLAYITEFPVQKEGYYFFNLRGGDDRNAYSWLITYDGKLPFNYLTKQAYLEWRRAAILEGIKLPYENVLNKDLLKKNEELLNSLSAKERDEIAVIEGAPFANEFKGFTDKDSKYKTIPIVPNLNYFNTKLPKSSVQFFEVCVNVDKTDKVYISNIAAMLKAIQISTLKNMLGK